MRAWIAVGLLFAVALAGCSSEEGDGDGDDISDQQEKSGWMILIETMEFQDLIEVTSDPKLRDTDGDGIGDDDEFSVGTNPRDQDTDGDGLSDCQELLHTNRSECEDLDFHGETDGGYGTDPAKADSDAGPSRYKRSQPFEWRVGEPGRNQGVWGDGLSDGDEIAGFTVELPGGRSREVFTDPRSTDSDGDGLEDAEELLQFGSDPTVEDTDGDGCTDGKDAWPDRAESYSPGLQSFVLHNDMDSDGADLQLFLLVGDVSFTVIDGGFQVARGENDISSFNPDPVGPTGCALTPFEPWMQIQVAAVDVDGEDWQSLDLWSVTQDAHDLGGSAAIWWNVRNGHLSWERGGDVLSEGRLQGVDGELLIAPFVTP